LGAKKRLFLETEADGAPAEEGIHFHGHIVLGAQFVAAQVERADDHRGGLNALATEW